MKRSIVVLLMMGAVCAVADEKIQITLILDSVGGEIYPSYKIINLLRNKCDKLSVFIPEKAKSAATLMTLGADEIIMSAESELGPLDLPMREHPMLEEMKEFSAFKIGNFGRWSAELMPFGIENFFLVAEVRIDLENCLTSSSVAFLTLFE